MKKGVIKFLSLIVPGGEGGSDKDLISRERGGGGLQGYHYISHNIWTLPNKHINYKFVWNIFYFFLNLLINTKFIENIPGQFTKEH